MKTDAELFTIGAAIQRGEPNPLTSEDKKELEAVIEREKTFIHKISTRKVSQRGFFDEKQSQAACTKNMIAKAKDRIKFIAFFLEN